MYWGGFEPSTGRRTPIRASEGLPRNSLKKPTSSVVVVGFRVEGCGEGDRPGDDLAFEGRLVGPGDAAGDRLEAGHVALDPAGRDLDVVDDLPGQDGGGVSEVWPSTTTRSGAESAAPGQATATRAREQAGGGQRQRPGAAGSVFLLLSRASISGKHRAVTPVAAGILPFARRRDAAAAAPMHDPGHAACCRVGAEMEASDRADDFIPAGLAALGIEADEVDLAVMGAVHQLFWPPILELLALDTSERRAGALTPTSRKAPEPHERRSTSRLRAQAAAIAAGEVDPAELLEATLARIEERNPALNAVVETFPERSREMLAAAPDGPLHGVPVVIKDEWPLPWRAQRFGAAEMLAPTAPGESGPYRALRDAGAMIVGVGNMHELGASSTGNVSVYGPARNPWNTERCPGGSSSGPAASVAGAPRRRAVGADGLGSVRFPAAYCGLTGLKPTFGRSAMEGHHMAAITDDDRLRPALRRRRRLPPAGLGAVRRGAGRGRRGRAADRRRPRRRLRRRGARGRATPARRRSRRCAARPAARCARSSCPTSSRRRWRRS